MNRKQRLRRVKATGAEAPEVETTEVKAESADEKKIQYWFMEGLRVHSTGQRIISIIL